MTRSAIPADVRNYARASTADPISGLDTYAQRGVFLTRDAASETLAALRRDADSLRERGTEPNVVGAANLDRIAEHIGRALTGHPDPYLVRCERFEDDSDSPFAVAYRAYLETPSILESFSSDALDEYEQIARMKIDTPIHETDPVLHAFAKACQMTRSYRLLMENR